MKEVQEVLHLQGASPSVEETVSERLTLGALFARYVAEGRFLPDGSLKTETYLQHVRQTGQWLTKFFGSEQPVASLTPDRIRDYVAWRRNGGVSEKAVGANTLQRDLAMFKAALNWACQTYETGRPLLSGHVLQKFKIPSEKDPRRPLWGEGTTRRLREVAPEVHPFLSPLITLAWRTGRRLSSILALRWEDVDLADKRIRWRAEHDKIRRTQLIPVHPEVIKALRKLRGASPGIGSALLFPHPKRARHPGRPVTRHLAAYWLKEAFRRSKLTKPGGSLWHAFRRVWATERKHLPLRDVAEAGGWRDTSTLLRYQQPDLETLRAVVEYDPTRRRRERALAH